MIVLTCDHLAVYDAEDRPGAVATFGGHLRTSGCEMQVLFLSCLSSNLLSRHHLHQDTMRVGAKIIHN